MKMAFPPTKKQKKLLDFIARYIKKHGYAPSIDEMAEYRKVTPGAIVQMLDAMERRKLIERIPHTARALKVIGLDITKIKTEDDNDEVSMLHS